jgi:hypothetical protein
MKASLTIDIKTRSKYNIKASPAIDKKVPIARATG